MPATDRNGVAITNPATQDAYLAVQSANITRIKGVEDDDMPTIQKLLTTWRDHYARNMLRAEYYQARYRYNGVAYSIPKQMRALAKPMIGWPNKAVRALADLNVFEGFDAPDPLQAQVDELVDDNAWDTDVSEAITSAYIHGCSFITVCEDPDEPGRILMLPRSADWSAGIWDRRRRRLGSALTITDKDDRTGRITAFTAWLPGKVYEIDDSEGQWTARTIETHLDRPSVVPLVNDAQSYHPLGNSRITRTLMNLTDFGLRTMVRMEATAEFYAAPPRVVHRSVEEVHRRHMEQHRERHERHARQQERRQAHHAAAPAGIHDPARRHAAHHRPHGQLRNRHPRQRPRHHHGQPRQRRSHGRSRTQTVPHRRPAKQTLRPRVEGSHEHRTGLSGRRPRRIARTATHLGTGQGNQRRRPRRLVPEGRIHQPRLRRQRRGTHPRRPDMGRDQGPPGLRTPAAHAAIHRRAQGQTDDRQDRRQGGRSQ